MHCLADLDPALDLDPDLDPDLDVSAVHPGHAAASALPETRARPGVLRRANGPAPTFGSLSAALTTTLTPEAHAAVPDRTGHRMSGAAR